MTTTQIEQDEFERLLEESFAKVATVADVVRGAVVKREKDGFLVDIGSKKEAFLPDKEISNFQDKDPQELIKVGDVKEFFIMKDFNAYIDAHEEIYARYADRAGWLRSVAMNIANSGRFSSDRTIDEYAAEIWNIKPCKIQ